MTTKSTAQIDIVLDAIRDLQTEADRWVLAESLAQMIPTGSAGFDSIIDAATAAGVAGSLKPNTLRLYRDTANRWGSTRVPNVSFSAHREAMVMASIQDAADLLAGLSKNVGADKVTVASVRRAIAVKTGKAVPAKGSSSAAAVVAANDVLNDLKAGAPKLIASLKPTTDNLDAIHTGLTAAIAHVERLRSKAARAAKPVAKATTTTTAAVKPAARSKAQGDLRGL